MPSPEQAGFRDFRIWDRTTAAFVLALCRQGLGLHVILQPPGTKGRDERRWVGPRTSRRLCENQILLRAAMFSCGAFFSANTFTQTVRETTLSAPPVLRELQVERSRSRQRVVKSDVVKRFGNQDNLSRRARLQPISVIDNGMLNGWIRITYLDTADFAASRMNNAAVYGSAPHRRLTLGDQVNT